MYCIHSTRCDILKNVWGAQSIDGNGGGDDENNDDDYDDDEDIEDDKDVD